MLPDEPRDTAGLLGSRAEQARYLCVSLHRVALNRALIAVSGEVVRLVREHVDGHRRLLDLAGTAHVLYEAVELVPAGPLIERLQVGAGGAREVGVVRGTPVGGESDRAVVRRDLGQP